MADIFDYINWRGDLSFEQDTVNCVDGLIFSQMAYFPFDGLWGDEENGNITLAEAQRRLWQRIDSGENPHFQFEKNKALFQAMAESRRYGGLKLRDFVNRIEPENEKQFAAVTVLLPGGAFIAYRGTDNTLVGWNEDFNMSFTTPVPSQIDALEYFASEVEALDGAGAAGRGAAGVAGVTCSGGISPVDRSGGTAGGGGVAGGNAVSAAAGAAGGSENGDRTKFWLGGHSKGGNLAMYAGLFCDDQLRNRIEAVYSNDGPGFDGAVVKSEMFELLEGRLHSFVPQSSVIGMLMEHEEDYVVVQSRQVGIMQHDPFSWDVMGADFVRLDSVSESSKFIDKTIKDWLSKVEPTQREAFVDAIFKILGSTNATSFHEIKQNAMKNPGMILKAVGSLDYETRKMVLNTISLLFQSAQESLPEFNLR